MTQTANSHRAGKDAGQDTGKDDWARTVRAYVAARAAWQQQAITPEPTLPPIPPEMPPNPTPEEVPPVEDPPSPHSPAPVRDPPANPAPTMVLIGIPVLRTPQPASEATRRLKRQRRLR
jgi:hypothetical protein